MQLSVALRLKIFNVLVSSVLVYGAASLVPTQQELNTIDIEVNKMRRIATGTPLWDGHSRTPTDALYRGDPRFSTVLKINRAKLVGHLLRHDSPFHHVMMWVPRDCARIKSLSEACADDIGIDVLDMQERAQDRISWRNSVQSLYAKLEPTARYNYNQISTAKREKDVAKIIGSQMNLLEKWKALQFQEEGAVLWPYGSFIHIYCDGSVRKLNNVSYAGAAAVAVKNGSIGATKVKKLMGSATSIRAELKAFLLSLSMGQNFNALFVIHVDCLYMSIPSMSGNFGIANA